MEDTISAIATALGQGAVGIIRLSGPDSLAIAKKLFRSYKGGELNEANARRMIYGHIIDDKENIVDEVLSVYMPGPHSYTGEDVVEIQCHGGVEALQAILSLSYKKGARPAEPGEFTKRAFLNGRMDLAQAEAVMAIIEARSKDALQVALRQQEGELSKEIHGIRTKLMDLIVHLEALIDYPEEDLEDVTYKEIEGDLGKAIGAVEELLKHAHTGKIMREGLRTAIVGRPNVGKSSLLNRLLKEERAIVSEIPGTTRDVIQEQMLIEGVPLLLSDTAGIHNTEDFVEKIGVKKSEEILQDAELVVAVIDGSMELQKEDQDILDRILGQDHVLIVNKGDLPQKVDIKALEAKFGPGNVLTLSAKTSEGLENFVQWLKKFAYGSSGSIDKGIFVQNARHEQILLEAKQSLEDALKAAENKIPYDCVVIDARNAIEKLGEITGETVPDEIINEIFARFCLGK